VVEAKLKQLEMECDRDIAITTIIEDKKRAGAIKPELTIAPIILLFLRME
jgi:hypothetical protein